MSFGWFGYRSVRGIEQAKSLRVAVHAAAPAQTAGRHRGVVRAIGAAGTSLTPSPGCVHFAADAAAGRHRP
jgi:hypothetical protein